MKILSINCRNWDRDCDKTKETYWKNRSNLIRNLIIRHNPDIVCCQELLPPMGNYCIPPYYERVGIIGISHSIWINKFANIKVTKTGYKIHLNWADVKYQNKMYRIINVHSHWDKDKMTNVAKQIKQLSENSIRTIACGDFNNNSDQLERFDLGELTNVARYLNKIEETFQNFNKPESHGDIDHFFVDNVTLDKVISFKVDKEHIYSDHYPIIMEIEN